MMNYDSVIVLQLAKKCHEMPHARRVACDPTGNRLYRLTSEPLLPAGRNSSLVEQSHILVHSLQLNVVGEGQAFRSPEPAVGLLKDSQPQGKRLGLIT